MKTNSLIGPVSNISLLSTISLLLIFVVACSSDVPAGTTDGTSGTNKNGALDGSLGSDSLAATDGASQLDGSTTDPGSTLTLEVMVGTDSGLTTKYGSRLACYVQEVMTYVNYLYSKLKPTVNINVVLVRHEADVDLRGLSGSDDFALLSNWIAWANALTNPADGQANHFDYKVLISSKVSGRGWSPTGQKICNLENGSIVQEEGYSVAKLIAHEMGHGFGLSHDSGDDKTRVMNAMPGTVWSSASISDLLGALAADKSCLLNYKAPPSYQGIPIFTVEQQCQGFFGFPACQIMGAPTQCDLLMCQAPDSLCYYDLSIPLDGSSCGANKWCIGGKCVDRPNDGSTEYNACP